MSGTQKRRPTDAELKATTEQFRAWIERQKAAEPRIGRTAPERLAWLVRFVQRDVDALQAASPEDIEALDAECRAFAELLNVLPVDAFSFDARKGLNWFTTDVLATLIAEIRRVIDQILKSDAIAGGTIAHLQVDRYGPVYVLFEKSIRKSTVKVSPVFRCGDARDCFLLAAAQLLSTDGWRIALCANAKCRRPFVRRKRGQYCSRACSQKIRTARYRQREEWPEQRHEYYRRQVARTRGPIFVSKVKRRAGVLRRENG